MVNYLCKNKVINFWINNNIVLQIVFFLSNYSQQQHNNAPLAGYLILTFQALFLKVSNA
jgi:hypothetical protein